jgi:hypothetical protein
MIATRQPAQRFGVAAVATLEEPVRRYLLHAIGDGAAIPTGVRLSMAGRINVGRWVSFTAKQEFVGHDFEWRARAGWRSLKPLHVVDSYRDGRGRTDGRLFGRVRFLHADDQNTTRAAAARAAVESIWVPGTLLPDRGAAWRAESDDCIVATLTVLPERPEVVLRIDDAGALRSVRVMRWGNVGRQDYGYIPFGGEIHAERRFGDFVLPSAVTVGWWFGTSRFKPFFEATIHDVEVTPDP